MLQHIQTYAQARGTGVITPKTGEELENIQKIIRPAASAGQGAAPNDPWPWQLP
jgi:hypothetical protein